MKQISYQMDVAFREGRIYLCDSYITGIEVQGNTTIFTFSNGVMTNLHTANLDFERTREAVCRIEHDCIEDIICHVRKKRYWFGTLLHFGREIGFHQLVDEVNKGKIRLEIDQEYYYAGRSYWICAQKKKKDGISDEVTIRMDGMTQFELTMQVSDT